MPGSKMLWGRSALAGGALFLCLAGACSKGGKEEPAPPIEGEFLDEFERDELGGDYRATATSYQLMNGSLGAKGAFNHPLWLRRKLPRDVQIEFDCWSNSSDGDIKVEFFGDGTSHATHKGAYKATGYVAIMGGWSNSKSLLARQDEHGQVGVDLVERKLPKVEVGKHYHWKIVRKGTRIDWYVDDMSTPFLSYEDKAPLEGTGHEYFGINNWESDTWFDNLSIRAL